ncbi:MAG: TonB-dependent receptor [Porticoccaceae bacterium]
MTFYPLDGLTIRGEFTYLDAEIDEYEGLNSNGSLLDYSGTTMPLTPKQQASLSGNYQFDISDNLNADVAISVSYRSETNATLGNEADYVLPEYTVVNASASIGASNDKWRLQLWGKNIFDEYYRTNVFAFQDVVTASAGQAPTYGITLTLRY